MMKLFKLYWNIVFYGISTFDLHFSKLIEYLLNPLNLINKGFKSKNINSQYYFEKNEPKKYFLRNVGSGLNITSSSAVMGGLFAMIEYIIIFIIQYATQFPIMELALKDTANFLIFFLILFVPALIANKKLLFDDDAYLFYFAKFDKEENHVRNRYMFISAISFICIISLFFCSLSLL